jgi:predicted nuclease with RNAse H fold
VSAGAFRTGGVDLASQDSHTALAEIAWHGDTATLESVRVGISDDDIVAAAADVDVLGIDCPLGWPSPFVDFLLASRAGSLPVDAAGTAADKQRLAFRDTDLRVRQVVGRWPLSVAADRIAYPAMRCAGALARLVADGHPVRRSGIGSRVAEVYPAGALLRWRVGGPGKKTDPAGLGALVEELMRRTPWLDWAGRDAACRISHDAFDAVVCALVAGAVVLGRTVAPTDLRLADDEGWIHLPDAGFLEQGPPPAP